MKRFFWFCSGATISILEQCIADHNKYAGIGATILLTALLGCLSGGYALFTVFQSESIAIIFALFWGTIIFNLDRVIVSSMRKQKSFGKEVLFAIPRFALAVLLALVITKPLELAIFEKEILSQIQDSNLKHISEVKSAADTAFSNIGLLEKQNAELRELERLKEEERKALYKESFGEAEGTSGTREKGKGPVYREKKEQLDKIESELSDLRNNNKKIIEENNNKITTLNKEKDSRIAASTQAKENANSMLSRIKALGELSSSDSTVWWSSWLIILLFISLETAPVAVKLLSSLSEYRPYDDLVEAYEYTVFKSAQDKKSFADKDSETNLQINTKKNRNRLDAEIKANHELMDKIASSQTEIASEIIAKWKEVELENVRQNLDQYVVSNQQKDTTNDIPMA